MPADAMARAQAKLDAGGLTPDEEAKLRSAMKSYEARVSASTEKPASRGLLGDPRAVTGGAAIEAVDEALPERDPSRDVAKEKLQVQELMRGTARPTPMTSAGKADKAAIETALTEQAGPALQDAEEFAYQQRVAEAEERVRNQTLKNLSKDPVLFAPPEHWSQQASLQPSIKDGLPFVGHEVWFEPSVEMFRRDMGATMKAAGLNPEKVDETDPLYHRYADMMWSQRYSKAQQRGESVIRHSQMKGAGNPGNLDAPPGEADSYGLSVLTKGIQAILGFDQARTGGLLTEAATTLTEPKQVVSNFSNGQVNFQQQPVDPEGAQATAENLRNLREAGPMGMAGRLAGTVMPGSLAGRLTGSLSAAAPAASGAAGILRGAAIGGKGAAGEALIGDVVQNLGDLSRGADPTVSLEQMGQNSLLAGGLGAGLGGAFTGVGQLAQAGKNRLLKSSMGKDIATMEEAGVEPGLYRSEPANVKAARQRTVDAGLGGDVKSMASRELGQPLARAWHDIDELGAKGELPRLLHQADGYFRSKEGALEVPINNTANAVVDLLESRTGSTGGDLPFMLNMEKFRNVRDQLFDTKTVTRTEASRFAEGGWKIIPSDSPSGMVTIGRPKQMNARELSTIVDQLDDLAGFSGKELTGPKEKAFRLFSAAVRKDRDKFGFNQWTRGEGGGQLQMTTPDGQTVSGFSALMGRLSEARRGSTKLLEGGGLSRGAPGIKSVITEESALPKSLDQVRGVEKGASDIEAIDMGRASEFYDPTGSFNISPRSAARRVVDKEHQQYIDEQVMPALEGMPKDIEAIKMFSLGYDDPIRMVQRGISPEEATRRYYKANKTTVPPQEFAKLVSSAAAHIEGALAKAPKATHVPVVYRGVNLNEFQVNRMLQNGTFDNDGMVTSFSRNPITAEGFGYKGSATGQPVLFKVKHKNGVGIESMSEIPQEQEVLLPGTSSFKITDAYKLRQGAGSRATLVIEAEELGESTLGKAPRPRSAVKGKLDVEPTEAQNKQLDKLIQNYRQLEGTGRADDAARAIARAAGVEEELKMWAAIQAANRVGSNQGVSASGGGIRGYLGGSLPQLAVRTTRTLNRLGAEPLAHAPKPSEELRALLKRLRGGERAKGPPALALLGMGSGGMPIGAALAGHDRQAEGLDPAMRTVVMGKEALRDEDMMTPEDVGWIEKLAEAFGRGVSSNMPAPQQQPAAPPAQIEEVQ